MAGVKVFKTVEEAKAASTNKQDKVFRIIDPDAKGETFVLSTGSVSFAVGVYAQAVLGISATSRLHGAAPKKSLKAEVQDLLAGLKDARTQEGKKITEELEKILARAVKSPAQTTAGNGEEVSSTSLPDATATEVSGEEAPAAPTEELPEVPPEVPAE